MFEKIYDAMLARVLAGRAEKSFLMVGLRGVGKTVLLNTLKQLTRMGLSLLESFTRISY